MRDGSGDRLVGSLHRPPPASGPARPLVVLIHGLSGCEQSHYMVKTAAHLLALGFIVLRLNLRGAGASRPHCRFQYYAGRSGDFADVLAALPFELIKGAIAVSAPLDLAGTARRMMWRRNSLYQRYLLRHMRAESLGPGAEVTAAERAAIIGARSIWEFDHRFSAPRNGFAGAEDYYERNAASHFLDGIAVPTLVIHALDDPWIPPEPYLGYAWRRNPSLIPLLPPRGGHVGFQGRDRRIPWHDLCATRFLAAL